MLRLGTINTVLGRIGSLNISPKQLANCLSNSSNLASSHEDGSNCAHQMVFRDNSLKIEAPPHRLESELSPTG
jgi:hypothetical protein